MDFERIIQNKVQHQEVQQKQPELSNRGLYLRQIGKKH